MKRNPRDIRGEMSKRARENGTGRKEWVAEGRTMAPEGCRRLVEYPASKGCEWSSSVEALVRRSAIIGAVACARRRTIDSSECKLLTHSALFSLSLSLSFSLTLARITRLEKITFFLSFQYDDYSAIIRVASLKTAKEQQTQKYEISNNFIRMYRYNRIVYTVFCDFIAMQRYVISLN